MHIESQLLPASTRETAFISFAVSKPIRGFYLPDIGEAAITVPAGTYWIRYVDAGTVEIVPCGSAPASCAYAIPRDAWTDAIWKGAVTRSKAA